MPQLRVPVMRWISFGPVARGLGVAAITQRQAAHVAALMYATGAVLVLGSLFLPHDGMLNVAVVAAVVATAAATSVIFAVFGPRMAPSRFFAANVGGTVLVSAIVAVGGSNSTAYAMLYAWVAIYAFYFFELRLALIAVVWMIVGAAAAELVRSPMVHQASFETSWLLAVGTAAVAGVVIHDLTKRLLVTTSVDPLTGAANRGSWDEQLVRAIALARRHGLELTVLMVDLDRFKVFNDDHGHIAGDAFLVDAVNAWRPELRSADLLARYGGEEFAFLLSGCGLGEAEPVAERLRAAVPGGQTCSIGIATLEAGDDGASLMARADAALYKAKALGRDRVIIAGEGDVGRDVLAETSRWAKTVQAVLSSGRTAVAFQAIRRLDTGSLQGVEALARPFEGQFGVDGLFSTAQRMGKAREFDWVCRRSALLAAASVPRGALIFVNVAAASLAQEPYAAERMSALAAESGIDPRRIVLEVTERENVLQPAQLAEVLQNHRRLGFKVAVDDVGEGHSTFELLAALVPDYVKVAASLVHRLGEPGPRSAIMAAAMFANASGAELIAEGIEDAETAKTLTILGARYGQGYHLGRPQLVDTKAAERAAGHFAATVIMPSPHARENAEAG